MPRRNVNLRYGALPSETSIHHRVGSEEAISLAVTEWNTGAGRGWPATSPEAGAMRRGWRVWMRPETPPETVKGAPGPWVEVDGEMGEIVAMGEPHALLFHSQEKQRRTAQRLSLICRLLRMPPLRIGREEALCLASEASRDPGEPRRDDVGRPNPVPHAHEGLRHWWVEMRPGYKPGFYVQIDGQTGELLGIRTLSR